jgi:hypothetical protein
MSFAPTFYPPNVATLQRAAAVGKSRQTPPRGKTGARQQSQAGVDALTIDRHPA